MSGVRYEASTPAWRRFRGGRDIAPMPLMECPRCVDRLASEPHLVGASASVGIEAGMTTAEVLQSYMRGLHNREGHES